MKILRSIIHALSVLTLVVASADAEQTSTIARVGFLRPTLAPSHFYDMFRQGMHELGYVEGKNLLIERRSGENRTRLIELAGELIQKRVEVIVTLGGSTVAAKSATTTVPIAFSYSGDPVAAALVQSLARPGNNLTGITWLAFELVGKRLELLKEAVPSVSRVAVLANPSHPGEQRELKETQNTARALGISLYYHQVRKDRDFNSAFDTIVKENADAVLVFPESLTLRNRKQITDFAIDRQLPSVFAWMEYSESGGLMSYGPDRGETVKRLAVYVDKILKGAAPAQLPVELPRKFDLTINLKTANRVGVAIPQSLQYRADRLIR